MKYKEVRITDSVTMPVPIGLTPEEEDKYILDRIAFVNFEALEEECRDALKQADEGKLVSLRSVLEELENEMKAENGTKP